MPYPKAVVNDVLATTAIELERMFTVLSRLYDTPDMKERRLIVSEIESRLSATLKLAATELVKNS